jgi:hypothetical protein
MSSEPIRPFQDARELLKPRLAAAARGDPDQPGKLALTYRVSGGPPGKRLFMMLRVSAKGEATYEHRDELLGKKSIRRKMILSEDQTISLLRQVHESGVLDLRDAGGGFLPDSTVAAIVIESDGSQLSYYFLAEEHQQRSQNKEPPPPIHELKLKFDGLCETMRKGTSKKTPAPSKGKKRRGGK